LWRVDLLLKIDIIQKNTEANRNITKNMCLMSNLFFGIFFASPEKTSIVYVLKIEK